MQFDKYTVFVLSTWILYSYVLQKIRFRHEDKSTIPETYITVPIIPYAVVTEIISPVNNIAVIIAHNNILIGLLGNFFIIEN